MLEKILKLLKSRQFWTIVLLFIVNGIEGVKEFMPANALPIINSILGLLSVYFRVSPKQNFE